MPNKGDANEATEAASDDDTEEDEDDEAAADGPVSDRADVDADGSGKARADTSSGTKAAAVDTKPRTAVGRANARCTKRPRSWVVAELPLVALPPLLLLLLLLLILPPISPLDAPMLLVLPITDEPRRLSAAAALCVGDSNTGDEF